LRQQIAKSRDTVRRSAELLNGSKPNTFAGHKTQEPFPAEDPTERADIQKLIRSELQPPME
jgi:hypothetical protein